MLLFTVFRRGKFTKKPWQIETSRASGGKGGKSCFMTLHVDVGERAVNLRRTTS